MHELVIAGRLGIEFQTPEDDDEEMRQEEWAQNQTDAALFAERYRVSNALMDDPLRNQDGKRKEPMPVNNVLSGANIVMRYGEGILDFVYADFRTPALEAMRYSLMWEALRKEYQAASPSPPADTEPEKVYNQTQEIVDRYFAYRDTLRVTKGSLKQSLYTMICPPVFADETDSQALERYYSYLRDLQGVFLVHWSDLGDYVQDYVVHLTSAPFVRCSTIFNGRVVSMHLARCWDQIFHTISAKHRNASINGIDKLNGTLWYSAVPLGTVVPEYDEYEPDLCLLPLPLPNWADDVPDCFDIRIEGDMLVFRAGGITVEK